MKKIINYIKSCNWTLFVVCMCMTMLGAANNKSIDSISSVFLIGGIAGLIFGIPFAIIGRDDNW